MTVGPPWRLEFYETLPSTSDACRARAEAGEAEGLAIQAGRQTAGRGTQGRQWSSPPGNLYMSVLLRPGGPLAEAPRWGLVAAVALAEALAPYLDDPRRLRLKWPNDVLLDGAKLAGMLAETAAAPDGALGWLVIGIGVNLRVAPALSDRPTACLGPGAPAAPVFAADVLARLTAWRARVATKGFAPARAAWLALGPAPGEPLRLTLGARVRQGRFAGLAEDGSLLLSGDGRVAAFAAGET